MTNALTRERPNMDHDSPESRRALDLLKTTRGQVDGIIKMIEGDRYCVDVSKQILSAISLLKKANLIILRQHMNSCVKEAFRTSKGAAKIEEIILLLEKYVS